MEISTYKCRDLYEASLIYSKNSKDFLGTEFDGRDVIFVFKGVASAQTATGYYNRTVKVIAKDYSDAIRSCKDIVFRKLRENNL